MSEATAEEADSADRNRFPILPLIVLILVIAAVTALWHRNTCGMKLRPVGPSDEIQSDAEFTGYVCEDGEWVARWESVDMF